MYGQKKDPKDVKTQPQEEFISPDNNHSSTADHEKQAKAQVDDLPAREMDEEGLEANKTEEQPQNGKHIVTEEKKKKPMDINR